MGGIGIEAFDPLAVGVQVFGVIAACQHLNHDAIGSQAVGEFLQHLPGCFGGFGAHPGFGVDLCQEHAQVKAALVFGQGGAHFGNGLLVKIAFGIHARQGAARGANFGRLHTIPASIQTAQFVLDRAVAWLGLKGAFHMPDGFIQVALVLADDAHAHMGDEIVGSGREHSLQDIGCVAVALAFQIGFAHQAVGIDVFRKGLQYVAAMGYRLIYLAAFDEFLYLLRVSP